MKVPWLFFAAVFFLITVSASSLWAAGSQFPLKWTCGPYRVDIREADGLATVKASGKPKQHIPYGGPMSKHFSWNVEGHSECGEWNKGICMTGGTGNDGSVYLYLYEPPDRKPVECSKR